MNRLPFPLLFFLFGITIALNCFAEASNPIFQLSQLYTDHRNEDLQGQCRDLTFLGETIVKGKNTPVSVYTCTDWLQKT